ncbi:MAG: hypothetical protein BroJett029_05640 [Alphaproteobacteria bacterium]|nr:MAG: hypothetical protein BroJett029_05640 [Alphaproteobacteria bacterium]
MNIGSLVLDGSRRGALDCPPRTGEPILERNRTGAEVQNTDGGPDGHGSAQDAALRDPFIPRC